MSLSISRQSYEDCYAVLDQALEAADGIRVGFNSREEATYFRMRMNQARQLDRKFNNQRYNGDDPRRRRSEYDPLSIRVRNIGDISWVYVEKVRKPQIVEEITGNEPPPPKKGKVLSFRRS